MPNAMQRTACIDIGTNTALLLVADLDPSTGRIIPIEHRQSIVRLGQDVDETKLIRREALDRLTTCLAAYSALCRDLGVSRIIAAGTSALRDAANRDAIIEEIRHASGIDVRCISGKEEAELTFFGAVAGLEQAPDPFTVIDIGGGSTEVIMGNQQQVERSVSMDIGSVRLTERLWSSLPPSSGEFDAAREEINGHLAKSLPPFFAARQQVFGVAGTLTTIAQVSMGDRHFDPLRVQGYRLSYEEVHTLLEKLRTMPLPEIVALGIPEGRADVITMGTLILHQFMRMLGIGAVTVSIQGLRLGMAQQELQQLRGRNDGEVLQ